MVKLQSVVLLLTSAVVVVPALPQADNAPRAKDRQDTQLLGIDKVAAQSCANPDHQPSWWLWWESRRGAFLPVAPAIVDAAHDERRAEAIQALRGATNHESELVRGHAAIALARMQAPELDKLLLGDPQASPPADTTDRAQQPPGMVYDRSHVTRSLVMVALGLHASPRSVEALLAPPADSGREIERLGRITGLSLLPQATDPVVDALVKEVKASPFEEAQRMAVWALRQHSAAADRDDWAKAVRQIAWQGVLPFAVQDALTDGSLYNETEQGDRLVQAVHPGTADDVLAAIDATHARANPPGPISEIASNPSGSSPVDRQLAERIQQELHTAAALGASSLTAERENPSRLLRVLGQEVDRPRTVAGRADLVRGAALLALGLRSDGENDDVASILNVLDRGVPTEESSTDASGSRSTKSTGQAHRLDQKEPESFTDPNARARGFAALAAGLYVNRGSASPGLTTLYPLRERENRLDGQRRDLLRELGEALEDNRNSPEFRAAAALALGLSRQPQAAATLRAHLQPAADDGDALTLGFTILGLALLDDASVLPMAGELLGAVTKQSAPQLTTHQLLGLRAALAGVAILGDDATLAEAARRVWPVDGWLGLEAATLSRRLGDSSWSNVLLDELAKDRPQWTGAAVMALGELFEVEAPSRLARLYEHENYAMSLRPMPKPATKAKASRGGGSGWSVNGPGVSFYIDPHYLGDGRAWWEEERPKPEALSLPTRFYHALGHPFLYYVLRDDEAMKVDGPDRSRR